MNQYKHFSTDNGLNFMAMISRTDTHYVLSIDGAPVLQGDLHDLYVLADLFKVAWNGKYPEEHAWKSEHNPNEDGYKWFDADTGRLLTDGIARYKQPPGVDNGTGETPSEA